MTDTKVSALADNGDIDPATGGDFYFAPSGAAVGKRVTAAEMYRFTALEARLDKTANYTAAAADAGKTIRGDATGGAITLKLPAAGTTDGDTITFRKADSSANRVTVQDNAGAGDIAWLSAQRDEVTFAWWNGSWIADTYYIQPLRQVFQASGTWIRPPLLTAMDVIAFGAGGGGGSGRRNTATIRVGGGGGGGGNSIYQNLPAGVLGSSETVTIGAGGAGGLSRTADTQNGLIGSNGGDTTFGAYLKA
ncbi:MAG: hypothetical protein JWM33_2190, partial [Caulobacteraceae bacterium]|nr:hypothetical protein [Caulobacteraceae bacterium]